MDVRDLALMDAARDHVELEADLVTTRLMLHALLDDHARLQKFSKRQRETIRRLMGMDNDNDRDRDQGD